MRRAVGLLIFDKSDEKLLLMQRSTGARHEHGKWEGAGGGVDTHEDFRLAAEREAGEELGVAVALSAKPILTYDALVDERQEAWQVEVFKAHITEGEPRLMEPHKFSNLGWFTLQEAACLPLTSYTERHFIRLGWKNAS